MTYSQPRRRVADKKTSRLMKLLNVGCGGQRPGPPWINLDCLRQFLKEGTPERTNLDAEPNYVEANLMDTMPLPFPAETFDGILIQHVLEHFACHDAVHVLENCRRVLKPGGVLVASVPDVNYFRLMHELDNKESAVEYFGEPISEPEHDTFFSYALFHRDHKQILNESGLWALLRRAGFENQKIWSKDWNAVPDEIKRWLNRPRFSTLLWASK